MLDRSSRLLYIGKAIDLRARLNSYRFLPLDDPKAHSLHSSVHDISWHATETEAEALCLEAQLIRELQPRLNRIGKARVARISVGFRCAQPDSFEWALVGQSLMSGDGWIVVGPFRRAQQASVVLAALIRWSWLAIRGATDHKRLFFEQRGAPPGVTRVRSLISQASFLEVAQDLEQFLRGKSPLPEIDFTRIQLPGSPDRLQSVLNRDELTLSRAFAFVFQALDSGGSDRAKELDKIQGNDQERRAKSSENCP
jgi:excinuclease UvrABC nuclease subunit